MCVHSDDCEMVCEDVQDGVTIADAFNTKFGGDDDGIKMCDPKFMLGVQRTTTRDEESGVTYHVLTQTGCVEDLRKPSVTPIATCKISADICSILQACAILSFETKIALPLRACALVIDNKGRIHNKAIRC